MPKNFFRDDWEFLSTTGFTQCCLRCWSPTKVTFCVIRFESDSVVFVSNRYSSGDFMKIRTCWPLYLLLIAFGVLGTRLVWTLALSETGFQPQLEGWANVARGLVGLDTTPLSDKTPKEQAEFWLREVANIDSTKTDPEVALGAAWVLNSPQSGFLKRHFRLRDDFNFPGLPLSLSRELDFETVASLAEEFEALCHVECIARIETAVQLDSNNVEMWQSLALLQFNYELLGFDMEPRSEDWLETLDECAEHDPDNALYDYLAALQLWELSAEYDYQDDGYTLKIIDELKFQQANERYKAGLAKPHLRFGTLGNTSTMLFLDKSSLSRPNRISCAQNSQTDGPASKLLFSILRGQQDALRFEKQEGRFDAAVSVAQNVYGMTEQFTREGNSDNLLLTNLVIRLWSLANIENLYEEHPGLIGEEEARKVSLELAQGRVDLKVFEEVTKRLKVKEGVFGKSGSEHVSVELFLVAILITTAQMLVIVTVTFAMISWLMARLFGTDDEGKQVAMGWFRHITAWSIAGGISFVIFGIFPAEIISPKIQRWLVRGISWTGYFTLLLGTLHLFRKRFQIPWAQLLVLVTMTSLFFGIFFYLTVAIDLVMLGIATLHPVVTSILLIVLLLLGWAIWESISAFIRNPEFPRQRKFLSVGIIFLITMLAVPAGVALVVMTEEFEPQAWISATVWEEAKVTNIEPRELQKVMHLEDSKWTWAFIQWQAHRGGMMTPLIAISVLMFWQLLRSARRVEGGLRQLLRTQKRIQICRIGNSIACSCMVASIAFSLHYLAVAPGVVELMDRYYLVHYERIVNPSHFHEEIAEAMAVIRSDEKLMDRFQAEIDERNREIAEREAWLEESRQLQPDQKD